ncbi:hypothetical protein [Aeromonas phage AS-zj]|uniref:Uncharacterized protein n=1 Tax=Aeromonas phage AS-zj TaxID=2024208 RepID=A0A223LDZ1_9CAUD|nr:hypothetical protein HWB28_gp379 [Aeromonas phage AS-zj]ASU00173.1 hypothetical protein [Aeromonas phage AS-zj]
MLITNIHNIRVYGRTVRVISDVIGYTPDYGYISVSSSILLECKTSKVKVSVKCDKCLNVNETTSCVIYKNPDRLNLCVKCFKSKAQKIYKSTKEGVESTKRATLSRVNNSGWKESRLRAGESYKNWYYSLPEEAKMEKRISSRKQLIRFGSDNGRWNPNKEDFKKYRNLVRTLTARNEHLYSKWENFDKIGKSGVDGAYQLDHIISIKYGFDHNICPTVIGDIKNLQLIPWQENRSKWY